MALINTKGKKGGDHDNRGLRKAGAPVEWRAQGKGDPRSLKEIRLLTRILPKRQNSFLEVETPLVL